MIRISVVSQEEKYEKAKLVEPNIIYTRFDIKYSGDFDVLKIEYDNKEQYITFHINRQGVCYIGTYMLPMEQVTFDEVIKFLRKKYRKITSFHITQAMIKHSQLDNKVCWVLDLPDTEEEYWAKFSSKTRSERKRKLRKLKEDYDVEFVYYKKEDITKDLIHRFFELKVNSRKDIDYQIDDQGQELMLSNFYNITDVYAIKINGKIEAIYLLSITSNKCVYGENITYNTDFSKYGLGLIVYYYGITQLIKRRFKYIYLGGGHYDYKKDSKADVYDTMSGNIYFTNFFLLSTYLKFIFECKNVQNYKVITILGIKFKFNRNKRRTIKIPILEKILLYDKIKGYNNKIQTKINGKWHNLKTKSSKSKFSINGDNNIVKFHFKTKSFPKGLDLTINGSNNIIDIYKASFKDTYIQVYRDKNRLEIKEQDELIAGAHIILGYGGSMFIGRNCELNNGGLELTVAGDYIKKHKMVIGNDTHIAKDTIIRTSYGQSLIDPVTMLPTDPPEDVIIGNHVWIMSRCIILKGSHIPNGCAIAANSLVNKKFEEENLLLCGTPAKIMKRNIRWGAPYGKYMENLKNNTKWEIAYDRK